MTRRPDLSWAALHARDHRGRRLQVVFAAAAAVGTAALLVAYLIQQARVNDLQTTVTDQGSAISQLTPQVTRQHDDAVALERQVKALGAAPVVQPAPVAPPALPGPPGRGITGTALRGGHLIVSYSDGTDADVGQVAGQPGAAGVPGVSLTSALIVAGHLVLSYSDGHTSDAGQVVGPVGATGAAGVDGKAGTPGRSVTSVANSNGHLIVSYSDNTTQDAGPLPVAQAGRPPSSFTFTDEVGHSYTCTPDTPADPGSSPHYTCTAAVSGPGNGNGQH